MTEKEYLLQARYLDERIHSKVQQVESLNDLATSCSAVISDMPRNPNRGGSKMADAVIKIVSLQEEINMDINALVELKREIMEKAVENEKYAFRCLLLRLGFVGAEYKADRKILLKNLTGSSAFKSGLKKEADENEISE